MGSASTKPDRVETLLFLRCEGCGEGLIAVVGSKQPYVAQWLAGQNTLPPILRLYPEPKSQKAPADIPEQVESAFLSGLENLGRKGGANAAAIMFRRSIEIAAKIIDPDAPKRANLKDRIERLPADVITPAMKKWAQHVRLDANEAAHEVEDYSKEDANSLHVFAEMFLTYAFTLPKTLERAQQPTSTPLATDSKT